MQMFAMVMWFLTFKIFDMQKNMYKTLREKEKIKKSTVGLL